MALSKFDYECLLCGYSTHRFWQMRRFALLLAVPILISLTLVSSEKATAQYIPPANGPVCEEYPGMPHCPSSSSSSGSSTTSDPVEVWKERFHKMAEANKRRKAESEAREKAATEAKAKQKQAEIDAENRQAGKDGLLSEATASDVFN